MSEIKGFGGVLRLCKQATGNMGISITQTIVCDCGKGEKKKYCQMFIKKRDLKELIRMLKYGE